MFLIFVLSLNQGFPYFRPGTNTRSSTRSENILHQVAEASLHSL